MVAISTAARPVGNGLQMQEFNGDQGLFPYACGWEWTSKV
jgi:hypothetical protein